MKFTIEYPVAAPGYDKALASAEGMARLSRAADALGFDAIAFTEHPAPSYKWLQTGGHESLDLVAALSFCAAHTERIRLMTYLLVVPYHHPLIAAKALTTLDLLSDGRLVVVVGTGYLRSEFLALGLEMEDRNEIFDEALEMMKGAWTQLPYAFKGKHFEARGVASVPQPRRMGGPPIVIGGNSALSRRRAARHQGWSPLMSTPEVSRTTRTPSLATVAQLAAQVREVRERAVEEQGEGTELFIQVQSPQCKYMRNPGSVEEHRDHLGQLEAAGIDSFVLQPSGESVEAVVAGMEQYADHFLS
ncbi:LLM class F420-dependent oxidoreductase [Streptomyces iranensis]|uniref:F420-dependent oxidoreductase n=1 Tax=Streptomyces iranensis TaxID=576784 RepID=A0A061A508_9ACTN|nr:LLM class F420-dependent oxidoreductase [Streptomyces iranensis]MBP2063511.1 putative F420-dependent oxidoreductase [Streptomyces iranensis]CDR17913.1 N5,N10-methylenetetrahydromethanopterinreductase-related protein [Streptomyces iranensis]